MPPSLRLTERQATGAHQYLAALVGTIEDAMRPGLARRFAGRTGLGASLSSANLRTVAPLVDRIALEAGAELVGHLLRRTEEERLDRAVVRVRAADPLIALIQDADGDIAADAMALLVARSRRLESAATGLVPDGDLSAELQHALVWTVAAALRLYLTERQGIDPAEADEAVSSEAALLIVDHDEGEGLESRAMKLAHRLQSRGRLDDSLLAEAMGAGGLSFFLAAIAARAGIGFSAAWDILADPAGRGAALLLRAADVARGSAAAILLDLGLGGEAGLARQLDLYEALTPDAARDALLPWRAAPAYRAALSQLLLAEEA